MPLSAQNQTTMEWKDFFSKNSAGPSVMDRVHGYRDNGTYADEFLRLFKYLLLPISVAVTSLFQFALVYHLALPFLGHGWSVFSAAVFSLFLEVAKIWLGIQLWRSVFFGALKWGIASVLTLITSLIIAIAAFYWSYSNSTDGTQYITGYIAQHKVQRDNTPIQAATSGVDGNITKTSTSTSEALSMGARKTAYNLTRIQLQQEEQRTALLAAELNRKAEQDSHRNAFIDRVSGFFRTMGGKMEILQIFLLFGFVLCERTLYDRLKRSGQTGPSRHPSPPPLPNQDHAHSNGHSTTPFQNRLGFYWDGYGTTTHPNVQNTVSQSSEAVTQITSPNQVMGCDEILERCKTAVERDLPNFNEKDAKKSTVSARINKALDACFMAIQHPEFRPSYDVSLKFYAFLAEKAIPTLNGRGWPYENDTLLMRRVLEVIPRTQAPA